MSAPGTILGQRPVVSRTATQATSPDGRPVQGRGVVVVGVDGSNSGRRALQVAASRAAVEGAALVAVHIPPPMPLLWSWSSMSAAQWVPWLADLQSAALLDARAAADRICVPWSFEVRHGDVAGALLAASRAHEAGLVVVAASIRHKWPHRCPATRLASTGSCPVFIAG